MVSSEVDFMINKMRIILYILFCNKVLNKVEKKEFVVKFLLLKPKIGANWILNSDI